MVLWSVKGGWESIDTPNLFSVNKDPGVVVSPEQQTGGAGLPRHAGEPQPDGGGLHHRQPRHPVGGVQGPAQPHLALQSKHDKEAWRRAGLGRLGTVGAEVDRGGGG